MKTKKCMSDPYWDWINMEPEDFMLGERSVEQAVEDYLEQQELYWTKTTTEKYYLWRDCCDYLNEYFEGGK